MAVAPLSSANTVGRAQSLYETLNNREEKLCDDDNLILFHARFPMAWRENWNTSAWEIRPNEKINPSKSRTTSQSHRHWTQVVEQSLDLDFDVNGERPRAD